MATKEGLEKDNKRLHEVVEKLRTELREECIKVRLLEQQVEQLHVSIRGFIMAIEVIDRWG